MTAREALKTYFGYDDFRPLQEEIRRDEQKAFAELLYDPSQDKAKARKRVSDSQRAKTKNG